MNLTTIEEVRILAGLAGLTMVEIKRTGDYLGSETAMLTARRRELKASGLSKRVAGIIESMVRDKDHLREIERVEKLGGKVLVHGAPGFPERLRMIPSAPAVLFMRGRLPEKEEVVLAMVGARRCTPEGKHQAGKLGREMAGQGVWVISGMARGIDSAAIRGCLSRVGSAIGVLGCGLDVIYPPENSGLYLDTAHSGALLSEFPLGTQPLKRNFPRRNRIISGLSHGVLVVEASQKSGSLITVDHALRQDRVVMSLPGPVGVVTYRGTNTLIRDGACVILEPEDIMAALSLPYLDREKARGTDPDQKGSARKGDPWETDGSPCARIRQACAHEALTLENIARRTQLDYEEVLGIVAELEVDGCLERVPGARFIGSDEGQRAGVK